VATRSSEVDDMRRGGGGRVVLAEVGGGSHDIFQESSGEVSGIDFDGRER
jgi:hypothetical protein